MTALLFDPLGLDLFQLIVMLAIAAALGMVIGMCWGGDVRDELDLHYAGRDIQGEARAGRLERRTRQRSTPTTKGGWQ